MIKVKHLGAHEVFGTNGAEDDDVTPNSLITKHTNTAASIETGIGLRYLGGKRLACIRLTLCDATHLVVKASLLDLGDENMIGLAGDFHSLFGNVAKNSDGNSRSAIELVSRRCKHRAEMSSR